MPANNFAVLHVQMVSVTPRVVTFKPLGGPRAGETIVAPRVILEDPGLVESSDDEISIAAWFAVREKLTGV